MTRTNSFRIGVSAVGVLMTFLACSSYAAKSSRSAGGDTPITVVIDAGHGGHDRGGIPGQRVAEKDMTLDVALRLQNILSANGYNVVMTRSSDVFVPLGGRVAIANSYRNAIFVCIHFNATPRSGASGIETYFYSRESLPLASPFIITSLAVRPQRIVVSDAVVITSCARQAFRRCLSNAVS